MTNSRSKIALVAAIAADLIQLPLTLGFLSGIFAIHAEALDVMIDFLMAALSIGLLGFHWTLLPTFMIETVPVLDVAPTWTACVSWVVWKRRHEAPPVDPPPNHPPQPPPPQYRIAP